MRAGGLCAGWGQEVTKQEIKTNQARERQRALAQRRKDAGQVKISAWVASDARDRLDLLVAKTGKSRDEIIQELILNCK